MSITNGYASLDQLKAEVGISTTDTKDDTRLEIAVASASRQIDAYCGRRFWQDSTVQVRYFHAYDPYCVDVADISTTTGLIVAIDTAATGTWSTTLTINTDFVLTPENAAAEVPVWPYTGLELVDGSYAPTRSDSYRRASVKITAKFGWPAVPDAVMKACLVQSTLLFKSSDAWSGGLQLSPEFGGVMRIRERLHPMAAGLVEEFVKQEA